MNKGGSAHNGPDSGSSFSNGNGYPASADKIIDWHAGFEILPTWHWWMAA